MPTRRTAPGTGERSVARTARRPARFVAATLCASIVLTACAVSPSTSVDGPVMRYPNRSFSDGGMAAEIAGVLELENGCLYVTSDEVPDRYPILWPTGTRWAPDIEAVVTADGTELEMGDAVWGGGGYLSVDDVRRLAGDEAAALAERCVDNTYGEVAVVNNQRDAIGPGRN